jgi:hypothetical protein
VGAGKPQVSEDAQATAQKALCSGLADATPGLAATAALGLGHAGLRVPLRLPEGQALSTLADAGQASPAEAAEDGVKKDVAMHEAEEGAGFAPIK